MKAGRDATNVVRLWTNEGYSAKQVRLDVVNIVYLCFLQMIHGRLALAELLEDEKERFRAEDIFVGIELQCFGFLCSVLERADYRYAAISARTETYSSLAKKHQYIGFFNAVCCQAGALP
jgi:hypothetical protein